MHILAGKQQLAALSSSTTVAGGRGNPLKLPSALLLLSPPVAKIGRDAKIDESCQNDNLGRAGPGGWAILDPPD